MATFSRDAHRRPQKLCPFVKMVGKHGGVPIHLKTSFIQSPGSFLPDFRFLNSIIQFQDIVFNEGLMTGEIYCIS